MCLLRQCGLPGCHLLLPGRCRVGMSAEWLRVSCAGTAGARAASATSSRAAQHGAGVGGTARQATSTWGQRLRRYEVSRAATAR